MENLYLQKNNFCRIHFALVVLFITFFASAGYGQNVTVNPGGGSYATLKDAFDAINLGTHTGAITVDIVGNTTETVTAILNASGGTASYSSILIQPSGGAARTVSGAMAAGTALLELSGADNVTINGLNSGGNSLTISNTTVSATSGTSTIRFVGDANSNTITNATILGSASMAVGTNGGNIFFSTAATGGTGNDDNTVSNCDIGPAGANLPSKGIHSIGTSTAASNYNNNNTISGNNLFDVFSSTVASAAIYIAAGNTDWTISNNRIYQTAARTQATTTVHAGIQLASANINNCSITGNIIGFADNAGNGTYTITGGATSRFYPIYLSSHGTTTATSIQNNTIKNISISGTAAGTGTSAPFAAILIASGLSNIGNSTGNTIGSSSSAGSILFTSSSTTTSTDIYGIYFFPSQSVNISNNIIGGIDATNTSTGGIDIYGIRAFTSSTSPITNTIQNNTVGYAAAPLTNGASATGSNTYGIYSQTGASVVTGNVVSNLTMSAANTGTGSSASLIGIWNDNTSATTGNNINNNIIHSLNNTNASAAVTVLGIQYGGSATGTHVIANNIIHSLSSGSSSATSNLRGINVTAGTSAYVNNMVRLGIDAAGASITSGLLIYGIYDNNTVTTGNYYYYNTVYVGGTGVLGSANTYAFRSDGVTNTRDFRNNSFHNARSNGSGTGKHYAIQIGGTGVNPTGLTSDRNNLRADGASGAILGFYDGSDRLNIGAWISATGQDMNSVEVTPDYMNETGNAASVNLKIDPATSTFLESGGINISGITVDFENNTRQGNGGYSGTGTAPDIGADEFEGSTPTCAGTPAASNAVVNMTPPLCGGTSFTLSLDVMYTAVDYQWQSSPDNSIWTNIPGATFSSHVASATVSTYYRAVITCPASGMSTNSASVFVSIYTALSGTYTINNTLPSSGTNYNNFVDAVAALNCRGISASVIFDVTAGQTFLSSDSLNITATGTSGNTITFQKSGVGANPLIQRLGNTATTNYILRIVGGDYFTFNGIDFQQTGTSATNWVEYGIYIQNASVTEGAKNNTFKNGVVSMTNASNASKGVYVHSSPTPTSITGTNSTNRFLNMTILNSYEGYRIAGATSTYPDDGNEINTEMSGLSSIQTLGDGTATGSLYGVIATYQTNFKVANTEISDLTPGGTSLGYGIALQTSTSNTAEFTGNVIHNIAGGGTVNGINLTAGDTVTISNNTIYSLSTTGNASSVRGIDIASSALGANVLNNIIYDLSSAGTTSTTVAGIDVGAGLIFNVFNNMISGLTASSSTSTSGGTKGITTSATTAGQIARIYYNTVLLTDVGAVSGYSSAGFYNSSSVPIIDFRNNIIINKSDVTTGTRAVAYWKSNTTINQHADTDNNLYYGGAPGAKNLLYYDGTNAAQTISALQAITGMAPREEFTVSEDVDFETVTGGIIRPDAVTPTLVESGGQAISGYNTDFENQPHHGSGGYSGTGTAPDIGADEFEGTKPSCTGAPAPSNAMVDLTPPLCPGVSFTVSLSVVYTGTEFQWQSSPDNAVWSNIGGAISATYNTGATVSTYYRAVITCPASGMSTNSGSVLVSVYSMLNGSYTINNTLPTGGTNYNNFPDAIADLHCRGVDGPVIFDVSAGQTFSSSDSLNILATGTAVNTITFQKSGVGANPLVQRLGTAATTNYILRIGGGDYFTFDGIDFEQTGTTTTDWVEYGIYIQNASATNGAKNNTFKNGIVSMTTGVVSAKGIYVHASPSATNATGTNSFNRFINMTVQNSFEGYRFSGTSSTYQDDGNEIGTELAGLSSIQTLGNGTVTGTLAGVTATYQQNFAIRNTEIAYVSAGGTSTVYGIFLSTSASDTTEISGNYIHDISGGGTVYGIAATSGDSLDVFNNNIYTLSSSTATSSFVRGIDISATGIMTSIYSNKIYDLSSSGLTTTAVVGMDVGTGIHNIYNNMISDLRAPASTTTTGGTRGISITGGTSGGTDRIYYNTVLLTDVGAVAGYTSAGIHNSSTTPTLDLRNNIVINKSDVTTGLRAVAFWKTSATDNVSNSSNNNLYFTGTPGAKNLIYYDGTTSAQTIAAYNVLPAITPGESYSVTEDVTFEAVSSGIIRPDQTVATLVESSGQEIVDYDVDFENEARGPYPLGGQANGGGFAPDLGADEGDFTYIAPPVPDCATLNSPANAEMNLCPYQDLELSWTPAITGGPPSLGFDVYLGTSPTPPFLANTLSTSYNVSGLSPNTTYYWKIVPKNPSGDAVGCTTFSFTTSSFEVLTTTPGTRCGFGSVNLAATGTGTLYWFDEATGGTVLGTGTSFNTPSINTTTIFYVGAGAFTESFGARPAPAGTSTTTASNYGLVFDADQPFLLESVQVYATAAGNVVINLTNSAGTVLQTATVAVTAAGATTPQTLTLNFSVPAGTGHRLLAVSSPAMVRESALGGFPYSLGVNGEITSGYISGNSTTYYYFYNWKMISGCLTPLEAVTATVTPADPITITPSSVMRCPSDPATSITASSTYAYTYTWSPATGLDTPNGPTVMANPSSTTTYTVLGDDGTCANTATVDVIVNSAPTSPMASATPNPACEGNSVNFSSSATAPAYVVSSITHAALSGTPTSIFITGDDTLSAAITLPFTFNYFGVAKTQMKVSSNGWITFNASETSTTNTVVTIPAAGAPNDAIYVLLDDVIVTGSGSPEVRYFTIGSNPNRTFVVEYANLKFWNSGDNNGLFNAQLHLKESTGNIEIHILDANDPTLNNKTIGIENSTGTQAIAAPGRNNTTFNITNASPLAWRFIPNTIMYSWSGPNGFNSNLQNPMIAAVTAADAGLYTVTISDNSGCSSTASVNLAVGASTVENTSDSGAGSLRDVIACAAPGATITFAPALSGQTITLTSGEIAINKNLTLTGLGAMNLNISGNNSTRIFRVLTGNTFNIEDMSLINGASVTNGGAFWNEGTMTIDNVIISGSTQNGLAKGYTGGPGSITEFLGNSFIND